jgi:hypothetical protein
MTDTRAELTPGYPAHTEIWERDGEQVLVEIDSIGRVAISIELLIVMLERDGWVRAKSDSGV